MIDNFKILKNRTLDGHTSIDACPCPEVCTQRIGIELDGDTVQRILFHGGCDGNTQGVSALAEGMKVDEVIRRLSGITCGSKCTSCPDQLARILSAALKKKEE